MVSELPGEEIRDSLRGNYDLELNAGSPLKLRMHVRELNDKFAECMARSGQAKIFQTATGGLDQEFARSGGDKGNIMDWTRVLYRISRGAELHGTVNPRVLGSMFRQ